jgi:hypothetical protein
MVTSPHNYKSISDFDGTISDPANNAPISQVLQILKSFGAVSAIAESDPSIMYNVVSSISQELVRYSCWYNRDNNCTTFPANEKTLIDHLLVSDGIFVIKTFFFIVLKT